MASIGTYIVLYDIVATTSYFFNTGNWMGGNAGQLGRHMTKGLRVQSPPKYPIIAGVMTQLLAGECMICQPSGSAKKSSHKIFQWWWAIWISTANVKCYLTLMWNSAVFWKVFGLESKISKAILSEKKNYFKKTFTFIGSRHLTERRFPDLSMIGQAFVPTITS